MAVTGMQERIITRRRDAAGREETIDTLQHMTPEEAAGFDQEWMQQAGSNLPSFGGSGVGTGRMLEQPRFQTGDALLTWSGIVFVCCELHVQQESTGSCVRQMLIFRTKGELQM